MGGYHSSGWYARHPNAKKPDQDRIPEESPEIPFGLSIARRIIGISFVIGGFTLMDTYFWIGFVLANFGFLLLLIEICYEPELLKRPLPVQVTAMGICFALWATFVIGFINTDAPLAAVCYEMQKGSYPDGTMLGGIAWDSHFTDLRVTLTNNTDDDYEKVDLTIKPDSWVYKAGLITDSGDCELISQGGNAIAVARDIKSGTVSITSTRMGKTFDIHDNVGNVYTTVGTSGGYRLRCTEIPSHTTIQIVFACINPGNTNANFPKVYLKNAHPGDWGFVAQDRPPVPSIFDFLGFKPDVKTVDIDGKLSRGKQPFQKDINTSVVQGN